METGNQPTRYDYPMLSASLERTVTITGNGLFSGEPCRAEVRPAEPGTGIVFIREGVRIPATVGQYIEQPNCSILGVGDTHIAVTEHILAALWAAGIDQTEIEVTGPELPNQDGSAKPMYDALMDGGRETFGPRELLPLEKGFAVKRGNQASLEILPGAELCIAYGFIHRELGRQDFVAEADREWAAQNILPARTFITEHEALAARGAGILRNTDETAALLIRDGQPARPLRFDNEYARHKVLDLIGDLYVLPWELTGNIVGALSGHAMNREMARQLAKLAPSE